MHPILARGRRLALYLLVFLQAGVLLAEMLVRTAEAPRLQALILVVPLVLAHGFSCLASWYLCRHLPLAEGRLGRLVISQLAAGLLAGGMALALGGAWAAALDQGAAAGAYRQLLAAGATLIVVFALFLYSLAAAVHYLLIAVEGRRHAEGRAYQLRILAEEAKLQALKAQIDPHFLFNSLNAINALIGSRPQAARRMCVELADFLRQSLRQGGETRISVAREVALAERYLAVEQARFDDRLRVDCRVAADAEDCLLPPLILQPLVENAVKHGIAHRLDGGTVRIDVGRHRGDLRMVVENPCDPLRPPGRGEGIGLANVAHRLGADFGTAARLEVHEEAERFRVTVTLPADLAVGSSRQPAASLAAGGRGR